MVIKKLKRKVSDIKFVKSGNRFILGDKSVYMDWEANELADYAGFSSLREFRKRASNSVLWVTDKLSDEAVEEGCDLELIGGVGTINAVLLYGDDLDQEIPDNIYITVYFIRTIADPEKVLCPFCKVPVRKHIHGKFGIRYQCEKGKHTVYKNFWGKDLSDEEVVELLEKKKIGPVRLFGKSGKSFYANLILEENEAKQTYEFIDSNLEKDKQETVEHKRKPDEFPSVDDDLEFEPDDIWDYESGDNGTDQKDTSATEQDEDLDVDEELTDLGRLSDDDFENDDDDGSLPFNE